MKAFYKNKIVEVKYYNVHDKFANVNGEWVDKKNLIIIPTEWTTYALIACGSYLLGLISVMIWNLVIATA